MSPPTDALARAANVIGSAPVEAPLQLGPFKGTQRSVSAELADPDYIVAGTDWLYLTRSGTFKRRGGQAIKFEPSVGASVGLLPAKWGNLPSASPHNSAPAGRCRDLQEFTADSISDGIPSLISLVTKEIMQSSSVLDDGLFSNVWIRDQVQDINYTLGSEFSGTTYPTPGTIQTYRYIPLFYNSGDGGLTRGVTEFARRFLVSGSRSMVKSKRWWYFPSYDATPARQAGFAEASEGTAIVATGPAAGAQAAAGWVPSSGGGINTKWSFNDTSAPVTPFTTAFECLAVDDTLLPLGAWGGLKDEIRANNLADTAMPLAGTLTFPTLTSAVSRWRLRVDTKLTDENVPGSVTGYGGPHEFYMRITLSDGNTYETAHLTMASIVASNNVWTTRDFDIDAGDLVGTGTPNTVSCHFGGAGAFAPGWYVTYLAAIPLGGGTGSDATYLIPTGPLPPTHAGSLAAGTFVAGSAGATQYRAGSDQSDGSWVGNDGGTDLYTYINLGAHDETYISSNGANSTCEVNLDPLPFTPDGTDTVTVYYRVRSAGSSITLTVTLRYNHATTITSQGPVQWNGAWQTGSFTLTAANITAVLDWTLLSLQFTNAGSSAAEEVQVADAWIQHTPVGSLSGGWRGKHRFYYAVCGRWEDDAVFMLTKPRAPNDDLPNGFNLFTVNAASPEAGYDSVLWQNLPVMGPGFKELGLCRTTKIDSTSDDNLQLDPNDLRVVAWVANGVTEYRDTFADDDSLTIDVDRLVIRDDHMMAPPARINVAGDSRILHVDGKQSPCAIILAPVGRAADYDLNVSESTTAAYQNNASYMRVSVDATDAYQLDTLLTNGITDLAGISIAESDAGTLEAVIDRINASGVATSDGVQWRAQSLSPNDMQAELSDLTPHLRSISGCTVTAQTISKASGGLSKVAVGARILRSGTLTDGVVTAINSDILLTFTGTVAAGSPLTLSFFFELENSTPAEPYTGAGYGWQRVICNANPGVLYFNNSYLDNSPPEHDAVWMTVATPLSSKSAPNCFRDESRGPTNKHRPPEDRGIALNAGPVDNGFAVVYSKGFTAIRNTRDSGTGLDSDYRMFDVDAHRGGVCWSAITPGPNCVLALAADGWFACDLFKLKGFSDKVWLHPPSDAKTGTGDYLYEIPLSVASTAQNLDDAMIYAKVLRGALYVNYRGSASQTHPNRQVVYDFSSDENASGIEALFRPGGGPYGWSTPLVRSMTCMTVGRRTDGEHLYGWNHANAGSAGDGRIDEFETGDTDNGTAIAATALKTAIIKRDLMNVSFQEAQFDHKSPTGATVLFYVYIVRNNAEVAYSFTPNTGTTDYLADIKQAGISGSRVDGQACYFGWGQTAGGASEFKKVRPRLKWRRRYK